MDKGSSTALTMSERYGRFTNKLQAPRAGGKQDAGITAAGRLELLPAASAKKAKEEAAGASAPLLRPEDLPGRVVADMEEDKAYNRKDKHSMKLAKCIQTAAGCWLGVWMGDDVQIGKPKKLATQDKATVGLPGVPPPVVFCSTNHETWQHERRRTTRAPRPAPLLRWFGFEYLLLSQTSPPASCSPRPKAEPFSLHTRRERTRGPADCRLAAARLPRGLLAQPDKHLTEAVALIIHYFSDASLISQGGRLELWSPSQKNDGVALAYSSTQQPAAPASPAAARKGKSGFTAATLPPPPEGGQQSFLLLDNGKQIRVISVVRGRPANERGRSAQLKSQGKSIASCCERHTRCMAAVCCTCQAVPHSLNFRLWVVPPPQGPAGVAIWKAKPDNAGNVLGVAAQGQQAVKPWS